MIPDMKESVSFLSKVRKQIVTFFGSEMFELLRSIDRGFDLSMSMNEKMFRKWEGVCSNIEKGVYESNKQMERWVKEVKGMVDKLVGGRDIKNAMQNKDGKGVLNGKEV